MTAERQELTRFRTKPRMRSGRLHRLRGRPTPAWCNRREPSSSIRSTAFLSIALRTHSSKFNRSSRIRSRI